MWFDELFLRRIAFIDSNNNEIICSGFVGTREEIKLVCVEINEDERIVGIRYKIYKHPNGKHNWLFNFGLIVIKSACFSNP